MPKILAIVKNPDPLLRRRADEIDPQDLALPATQELIDDMIATMWQEDGVGIAAPQVGRSVRIVIITQEKEAIAVVNPIITWRSFRKESMEEGCLSVPGFYGSVRRPASVTMKALDRYGKEFTLDAKGLLARIIQHEIDHLDGVLFTDRAKKVLPINSVSE